MDILPFSLIIIQAVSFYFYFIEKGIIIKEKRREK